VVEHEKPGSFTVEHERHRQDLDVDEHAVPEQRHHPSSEATPDDEVERVGEILPMEHDLASRERPPARDREELPDVVRREVGEQRPLHRAEVCVTAVTFATSRARTTPRLAAPTLQP